MSSLNQSCIELELRLGFEKRMFPFAPDVRLILWGVDLSGHFQRFGPFLVFLRAH